MSGQTLPLPQQNDSPVSLHGQEREKMLSVLEAALLTTPEPLSLAELKKLFPPAKVEYIEKQPSLEDIFLAIVGKKEEK